MSYCQKIKRVLFFWYKTMKTHGLHFGWKKCCYRGHVPYFQYFLESKISQKQTLLYVDITFGSTITLLFCWTGHCIHLFTFRSTDLRNFILIYIIWLFITFSIEFYFFNILLEKQKKSLRSREIPHKNNGQRLISK